MSHLIQMYAELADLTREVCSRCTPPFGCCSSHACDHAKFWARHAWGVELKEHTEHVKPGRLPFLAPATGCSVGAHLRPTCSIYVCGAAEMPARYHQLVAEILKAEQERWTQGEWVKKPT